MAKEFLTDEQVEIEIDRIRNSEAYKLGAAEIRWKNKRRQYMYQLRWIEKRGNELIAQGKTADDFHDRAEEADDE